MHRRRWQERSPWPGFVTAAGLILAWWATILGRQHRDGGAAARFLYGDRRRTFPRWRSSPMFRDIILWLAGVPIFVIILLHVFGLLH